MSDELKLKCVICGGEHATQQCPQRPAPSELAPARGSANALAMREKALRDIKAVHTRWYHRGEITAEQAVIEIEAIAVSVWQREYSPNYCVRHAGPDAHEYKPQAGPALPARNG